MLDIITDIIAKYGYIAIYIGMVIESASIPLPSELIMGFAGYLVALGKINFWIAVISGTLGNITGSTIMYVAGYYIGKPFIKKYGKFFHMNQQKFDKAHLWFKKYGNWTVLIGQLLPGVRTFISLPAGILHNSYLPFITATFLGAFIWCAILTYVAMLLGQNWYIITKYMHEIEIVLFVTFLVAVTYILIRRYKLSKNKK